MRLFILFSFFVTSVVFIYFIQGCSSSSKLFENISSVKYYGGYDDQKAAQIIVRDGKKYILGTSSSFSSSRIDDVYFIVTDRLGNEIFSKFYGENNIKEVAVGFVPLDDGFMILFNYETTAASTITKSYAIKKIDFFGNGISERKYYTNNRVATSLLKVNENEFIVTGFDEATNNQKKLFFVTNINAIGHEKWTINGNKGFSTDNEALKSHLLLDNKILIFGNADVNQPTQNVLVFILDNNNGSVINSKFFGGKGKDSFYGYTFDKNTFYVVGSSTSNFKTQTTNSNNEFLLFNFEANSSEIGEQQNEVTFGGSENDIAKSVIIDNNGDLIIYGETQSYRNNAVDFDQIIVKTNKFSVVYQDWLDIPRLFGSDGLDRATQILYIENSIFLLGEINFSLNNSNTLISLIKTNIQGKIIF